MGVVAQLFDNVIDPGFKPEDVRVVEALLFAAAEPLEEKALAEKLPRGCDVKALMLEVQRQYSGRGVNLVRAAGRWMFRTSPDMAWLLAKEDHQNRKLSRAAVETLAIVAYHQPVTRAEIEDIRGVAVSKGALDVLMEAGWVRMRGRRKAPGRPITYGTTPGFLIHFSLDSVKDLPGLSTASCRRALGCRSRTTRTRCGPTRSRSAIPTLSSRPGGLSRRPRTSRRDGHETARNERDKERPVAWVRVGWRTP